MGMGETKWHAATVDETLDEIESTQDGLSSEKATQRLEQYGPNTIG